MIPHRTCWMLALPLVLACACGPAPAAPAATPVPTLTPTDAPPATPPLATETPEPSSTSEGMPVIFDDDGSPDGTTALFYLLCEPLVSVRAIGVSYGEAHPGDYIQHIGRVLDSLHLTGIPLGAGQAGPLAGDNEFPEGMRQAAAGFWGFPLPNADRTYPVSDAARLIVATANRSPVPVTIFVSGPATNLAQALRLDPDIRQNIAAVFFMGGAVYVSGNLSDLVPNPENAVAEWNVYGDPLAASEVFQAGLKLYLVPLDATNQVMVGREDTARWQEGGATADWAATIYDSLLNAWGVEGAAIWDLMTAAIMVRPDLCGFEALHLEIDTALGGNSGQTVVLPDAPPNVQVCLDPDAERIRETLAEVLSHSP